MNITGSRPCKLLLAVCFAFLFSLTVAFSQPALPPDPFLGDYLFETTNWLSIDGDAPITFTNLVSVSLWNKNALLLDTTNATPAFLNYNVVESDGFTNVTFDQGGLRCVYITDWATADTNQNGTGPGDTGYLVAAGDWSSGAPDGFWAFFIDAGGTNIYFGGVSNSTTNIFVSAPISWPSNSIHLIGAMYSSTNSQLFLDGQLAATGGPVSIVPATNTWTNGFFVGSDSTGYEQARGVFSSLEFFDSNVFNPDWSEFFTNGYIFTNGWPRLTNAYYTWLAAQGSGFSFGGGGADYWTAPPTPTNSVNTNYANYANFWLLVSNSPTQLYVSVANTLSNVTYEVLTNRNLASTNWAVWTNFVASNSVTPLAALNLTSNAQFFNARMVWSTCTTYNPPLPDWWAQLYFGSTACVNPNANPTGDGIDNWDKYLLGLNPNVAYGSSLIITPPGGNYIATPMVTIFSLLGSSITYTTNGSIPSATNGITVASGVSLTNLPRTNFTLKALENGSASNIMAVATYSIIPATPVFSLASGTYATGATLAITCPSTNATIYYTTNGSTPTTSSAQIGTNILTLTTNVTVEAVAYLGTNASPVAAASYIIEGPPVNDDFTNATVLSGFSGEFSGTVVASTIECFESNNANFFPAAVTGNSVWYQWTAPSNGTVFLDFSKCNPVFNENLSLYSFCSNIVSSPSNLMAVDFSYDSDLTSETFTATSGTTYYISISDFNSPGPFEFSWQYVGLTDPPILNPGAGTYQTPVLVTVSDNDTNAVLRYTVDGSDPSTNSTTILSGNTLFIGTNETLKAVAWRAGLCESSIAAATYTINPSSTNPTLTASSPVLSPLNIIFTNSTTVTLTDTNDVGATMFYTLDGSIPTTASAYVASGSTVTISNSAILNAVSWVTNMNLSPIASGQYAKWDVDTAADGIPDSGKLQIGANILLPDAGAVNSNPLAHGLDNLQVYDNPSVLISDNYSTENDGVPQ